MMDHLRQIPQVGAAWADIPEPYTALSWLAAVTERVRLGVLVSPAFRHHPAGARQTDRHARRAVGRQGDVRARRRMVRSGIRRRRHRLSYRRSTVRAPRRRAAGAPSAVGRGSPRFAWHDWVTIPETLCYPRPIQQHVPVIVGGSGERRTLRLVAQYADGCNLFGEPDVVARKVAVLTRHCAEVGRDIGEIDVSHLSTVLIGRNRDEVAASIERLRPKRMGAERFARDTNAGTVADHYERAMRLIGAGARPLIVRLVDVADTGAVETLGNLIARLN